MATTRGVIRPTSTPKPGNAHAAFGKGGIVQGAAKPQTGTGGIKTAAHGQKGGLIQPGGAMSSRGGKAQSNKKAC